MEKKSYSKTILITKIILFLACSLLVIQCAEENPTVSGVTDLTEVPAPATGVVAIPGYKKLVVNWVAPVSYGKNKSGVPLSSADISYEIYYIPKHPTNKRSNTEVVRLVRSGGGGVKIQSGSSLTVTVDNLSENESYEVVVGVASKDGGSKSYSSVVVEKTLNEASKATAPSVVRNITFSDVTNYSMKLSWDVPLVLGKDVSGGDLLATDLNYVVYIALKSTTTTAEKLKVAATTVIGQSSVLKAKQVVLSNLQSGGAYQVVIESVNGKVVNKTTLSSIQEKSTLVNATSKATAPSVVRNIRFSNIKDKMITATWDLPQDLGKDGSDQSLTEKQVGYELYYIVSGASRRTSIQVTNQGMKLALSTNRQVVLPGLTSGVTYEMVVVSVNRLEPSYRTSSGVKTETTLTSSATAPGAVSGVMVSSITNNRFILRWTSTTTFGKGFSGNNLTEDKVIYRAYYVKGLANSPKNAIQIANESTTKSLELVGGSSNTIHVFPLSGSTTYDVVVASVNSEDENKMSFTSPIQVTTVAGGYDPVQIKKETPLFDSKQPRDIVLKDKNGLIDYTITNIRGPVTDCYLAPAVLPGGVKIKGNNNNCQIYSTSEPDFTKSETKSYTLTGYNDGSGLSSENFYLKIKFINTDIPTSIKSEANPQTYRQGEQAEYVFKSEGGVIATCAMASGSTLPRGLSIVKVGANCVITGTPTSGVASAEYTVEADNTYGPVSRATITIEVKDDTVVPNFIGNVNLSLYKNQAMDMFVFNNAGGSVATCSVSPNLPAGITISEDKGTCKITGTPTVVVTRANYTVTGQNSTGNGSMTISLVVINSDTAPNLVELSGVFVYFRGESADDLIFTNNGGPVTACVATPPLPSGVLLLAEKSTCKIGIYTPSSPEPLTTYSIKAENTFGSVTKHIQIEIKPEIKPPVLDTDVITALVFYEGVASSNRIVNSSSAATKCWVDSISSGASSFSSIGLAVSEDSGDCVVGGKPTAVTNLSFTIHASNSAGRNSVARKVIDIKANVGAPSISSSGVPPKYIKDRKIPNYIFANSGGAVAHCAVDPALPRGLNVVYERGSCGVAGTPVEISARTTYYFTPTNSAGGMGYRPSIAIEVGSPNEQTADGYTAPYIGFINSSQSLSLKQKISIEAGKYYGTPGNYLNLYIYGPYTTGKAATNANVSNDVHTVNPLSLENISVPKSKWKYNFEVTFSQEGYYKLFVAFCVTRGSPLNGRVMSGGRELGSACKPAASGKEVKVIQASTGTGGGGGSSQAENDQKIRDLQDKTSAELLTIEKSYKSERLNKAIDNLVTRPGAQIERELKGLLDKKPSFASLQGDYSDVVRVLEIFKARYVAIKDKVGLKATSNEYEQAKLAWEWLFPARNGHIIRFPDLYEDNVAKGDFPYTFRNFIMATALFPNFCGDSVGVGIDSSEANLKLLCTQSMAEMFAHFAQEVGAHEGNPVATYTAPINGKVITAAKAGDAGGMKNFVCQGAYDTPNKYGFSYCKDGDVIPEWRQAFYWVIESGCGKGKGGCEYRECAINSWQGETWPCPADTKYFGRGAKQLSYNYNYGPFSQVIYGTVHTLLQRPDKVTEGWLAIASAVYFFMQPRPPKPSMFERSYGFWSLPDTVTNPKALNLKGNNFAASIMIINGGVECGGSSAQAQSGNRVKYYLAFMDYFGLSVNTDQADDTMTCANTDAFEPSYGASYNTYWVVQQHKGGCFLVSYEGPFSGFLSGDYEKCIRSIVLD